MLATDLARWWLRRDAAVGRGRAAARRGAHPAQRIGGPPDLESLADFIFAKRMKRSRVAGSLRALGEGSCWTQSRLYEAEVEGKSGTCAELSTVYRRLSLRDAPVVDLEVIARVVEKPRTSPTTVCSVEL